MNVEGRLVMLTCLAFVAPYLFQDHPGGKHLQVFIHEIVELRYCIFPTITFHVAHTQYQYMHTVIQCIL
jgi:hypothetical protein